MLEVTSMAELGAVDKSLVCPGSLEVGGFSLDLPRVISEPLIGLTSTSRSVNSRDVVETLFVDFEVRRGQIHIQKDFHRSF